MPLLRMTSARGRQLVLLLLLMMPAILVADCVGASAPAMAQGAAVREIRVTGNRRVEPETVRSYMQISPGDAYDAGKVDRSLRALFAEIEAAARQYVRKISGVQKTSEKTEAAFEKAVRRITLASEELLAQLPPRQQPPKTEPPLRRIAARAAG